MLFRDLDALCCCSALGIHRGAMENKSLNIFNSRLVLATPQARHAFDPLSRVHTSTPNEPPLSNTFGTFGLHDARVAPLLFFCGSRTPRSLTPERRVD